MKATIAALALLALVPGAVEARSAYAACLKTEQLMGGSGPRFYPTMRFGGVNTSYWLTSDPMGNYMVSPVYTSNISSASSWAEHERVMGFVRACRHLKKSTPSAFRVVGVKSPSQRTSVNASGRKAGRR